MQVMGGKVLQFHDVCKNTTKNGKYILFSFFFCVFYILFRLTNGTRFWLTNLVGISETTHARHDTQDVVGHSVHEEFAVVTTLVVETR